MKAFVLAFLLFLGSVSAVQLSFEGKYRAVNGNITLNTTNPAFSQTFVNAVKNGYWQLQIEIENATNETQYAFSINGNQQTWTINGIKTHWRYVGGMLAGGSGTADGNNYTTNMTFSNNTLTLERNGMDNLTVQINATGGSGTSYNQSLNTSDDVNFNSVNASNYYGLPIYNNGTGNISGGGEDGYITRWSGETTIGTSQLYRNGTTLGLGMTTQTPHPLEIWTTSGGSQLALRTFANSVAGANFRVMRARGTPTDPLRLRAGDVITGYNAFAYYADNDTAPASVTDTQANGQFQFYMTESATSTAKGTSFRLNLVEKGATAATGMVSRLVINDTWTRINNTIAVPASNNSAQWMCLNITDTGVVGAYKC